MLQRLVTQTLSLQFLYIFYNQTQSGIWGLFWEREESCHYLLWDMHDAAINTAEMN